MIWTGKDFAAMKTLEQRSNGKLIIPEEYKEEQMEIVGNGKILDLLLPLIVLIGGCIFGMLYTGAIIQIGAAVASMI